MSRRSTLLIGWTLALLVSAGLARLGLWQSHRAVEKEHLLAQVSQVLAARRALPLSAAADATRTTAYDWAAGHGHFLDAPPLMLDNQQRDGRVGVHAYAAFQPDAGAPLLVDLGWLPMGIDRVLPKITLPRGEQNLRGLLVPPPSAGLRMGAPMARQGGAWLVVRLEPAVVAKELKLATLAPRVLRLDPALPIGYARDLELLVNTLPPDRHRGYAVQWYGLAITMLAIALVLTFRRSRR
ncbi:SURF1 family protein [Lysobacter sp. TY2-98]|uniref:SURF1 family protein n=1 Tax=Lysobacter sp. TY2-98 TaxID=2290922 RepID=UPI000E203891|nr:SURF1 family protein [Lysobacter sp. TY2-98]AXK72993.1 SURF1 family protein [Lysobacter sp. TY2-98]